MSKFSEFLSRFGTKPKTLDQATATIDAGQPMLASVAALFSAASLDLDAMLAAGPDALKTHIEAASADDGKLAEAQTKIGTLETQVAELNGKVTAANESTATATGNYSSLCAAINFDPAAKGADGKPLDFKVAFEAHVKKGAAAILAKDGRPSVPHETTPPPGKEQKQESNLTGRDRYAADFRNQLRTNFPNRR